MAEDPQANRTAWDAELFRLHAENVEDYALFIVDPEGIVRRWGLGAERLLGYSEDEILGQSADLFFTPEDVRDGVPRHEIRESIDTGRASDDRWHVRKDNSRFWASGVMTCLRDGRGELRGLAKIMRDRTEWWAVEQARRESEARNAAILEAAIDCIITMNQAGNIVEFNPAAEVTFGYTRAEAVGREMATLLIPPALRDAHRVGLSHYLATGVGAVVGRRIEITAMRAGGVEFLVELAITRIAIAGPPMFTAYLRDITERKRAEASLDEQRRLVEFGRDVGLLLTENVSLDEMLDRAAAATVRHLNGAFARIWTLNDPGDVLELKASAGLYTHLDGPHARVPVGRFKIGLIALEKRPHLTNSVVGDPLVPDQTWAGQEGLVAFAGYPLIVEDRLVGVWAMFARHALSARTLDAMASVANAIALGIERKRAEDALRASKEEAERANKAKDQFLAVLSHELRTPLNPILLAASSMLDRPTAPEDFRSTMEMIRHNVNLQSRLIDDLLDVMRIVQGKMPLHWGVADCHDLIHHAVEVCRSEIFGRPIRLLLDLAAEHHHVNADSARLQQVFWNLIKNAVKFSPEGGTLTIRTRNDYADPKRLLIDVSDTGIGIEADVLPCIFDPFQQGETSVTRRFGGLGLGLAICRGVVEAHGGTISAASPGRGLGTTFTIAFTALPTPTSDGELRPRDDHSRPEAAGSPTTPLKVLVVEDEDATRRLMARLLSGLGHEVTAAGTIAEAISSVEARAFDLIVSDIGLPDGSGLELMRRVVARIGPVPAIALTGYGMEEDIVRSRQAGFTAHMTKPIDFTKLEAMIRQVTPARL